MSAKTFTAFSCGPPVFEKEDTFEESIPRNIRGIELQFGGAVRSMLLRSPEKLQLPWLRGIHNIQSSLKGLWFTTWKHVSPDLRRSRIIDSLLLHTSEKILPVE